MRIEAHPLAGAFGSRGVEGRITHVAAGLRSCSPAVRLTRTVEAALRLGLEIAVGLKKSGRIERRNYVVHAVDVDEAKPHA